MAKPVGPVCNLRCDYCYYLERLDRYERRHPFRMPEELLDAYVRQYIEASTGPVVHFVWHGGEPTLLGTRYFGHVVELQDRHMPTGRICVNTIQTNGTGIDDEWGAFFADHRFHVGLSLDGPAWLHDRHRPDARGGGSHARALGALERLRAHGIEPDVLCTLNADTAAHPDEVYEYFRSLNAQWLQFLPVVRHLGDGAVTEASVGAEAFGEFLCTVFDRWVANDVGRCRVQIFDEALRVCEGEEAVLCTMAETCGQVVVVEHDGDVFCCDHYVRDGYRLGNIAETPLGELVRSPAQVAFGRAKAATLSPACLSCEVRVYCHGGCPKDRFATWPDGEPGRNHLCAGYRRFFTHAADRLERIARLRRQGLLDAAIGAEMRRSEAARWRAAERNGPCPCGSGRRYKRCCWAKRHGGNGKVGEHG